MWQWYRMRAGKSVHTFYAPSLDTAFGMARKRWPMAQAWECMGATNEEPA